MLLTLLPFLTRMNAVWKGGKGEGEGDLRSALYLCCLHSGRGTSFLSLPGVVLHHHECSPNSLAQTLSVMHVSIALAPRESPPHSLQEACVSGREGGNATSFSSYTQYTRHVEKEDIKQNLLSLSLK